MRLEEAVDALSVPSNQRFLSEFSSPELRRLVIATLMAHEIVPAIRRTRSATTHGFSVQWTYGEYQRKRTRG
jgi:hypothetical protein